MLRTYQYFQRNNLEFYEKYLSSNSVNEVEVLEIKKKIEKLESKKKVYKLL